MDHSGMDHGSMTMTTSAAAAAATGGMDHDMSGGMDMGNGRTCKISMLFNVNTIGSCFLTDRWYIETAGQFAGACIATFVLVGTLEALRRSAREYDRFILQKHIAAHKASSTDKASVCAVPPLRPSLVQQAVRAFLHMLQFGLAYIVMLLAMYYNGYLFLCIVLGSFFGYFAFNWEPIPAGGSAGISGKQEATVCCG